MRGRTRNLLENFIAFIIFLLLLFGIYFLVMNYTDLGKKFELVSPQEIIENIVEKKNEIEEIIDGNITTEMEEDTPFKIVVPTETNSSTQIKDVEEVNTTKEIVEEPKKEEIVQDKAVEPKKEELKVKEKKLEEPMVVIEKVEPKVQEKTIELKDENVTKEVEEKEEPKIEAKKPEVQKEEKKAKLTDKLIKEKFALLNSFLKNTKNQINKNVADLNIVKIDDKSRYANIRVTVLKDGGYEQLKLMDGDKEYFEQITPAILGIFPVSLDEKIDDQFPRYFRMKVIED